MEYISIISIIVIIIFIISIFSYSINRSIMELSKNSFNAINKLENRIFNPSIKDLNLLINKKILKENMNLKNNNSV